MTNSLWVFKYVALHFFSKLIKATGKKRYYYTLMFLRVALTATFVAVIISNLTECRPFHGYWQVTPDPGPQCRQGVASLLTTSACNAMTDILLVIFPVPIILSSRIKTSRKIFLVLLFSLGLVPVVVSICRVFKVLDENGYQGTRTTWASIELLVGTIVANTQVLGSFIRDTGVKKARFRPDYGYSSHSGNNDNSRGAGGLTSTHMTNMSHKDTWGDQEDQRDMSKSTLIGMSTTIKATASDMGSKPSSGRESEDSLIPKGHVAGNLSQSNIGVTVVKTTRIEVTVEQTPPSPPSKPMQVRSASIRGTGRGSTKLIQGGSLLPVAARGIPS